MSVLPIEGKLAEKKAQELRGLICDLDSICDILYSRLDYSGIWDVLMELEEVRVKYYTEFFEYDQLAKRGK